MENNNVVTEQNVAFDLQIASFGDRFLSFLLDTLIQLGWVFFWIYLIGEFRLRNEWFIFIVVALPYLLYHPLMEIFSNGQSLGKKWRKIRVIQVDGRPETIGAAIIRSLLKAIDRLFLLGLILILATEKSQRLGDLAAGTCLVYTNKQIDLEALTPKVEEDYTPIFDVTILNYINDREVNIVRKMLKNRLREPAHKNIIEASQLFKEKIPNSNVDLPPYKYLDQLVKDYDYYVLSEF